MEEMKNGAAPEEKPMTIEETFDALDVLIEKLERGEGSLEEAFERYEEGMRLVKNCSAAIDKIEKQVLVLSQEHGEESEDVGRF